jgi:hypothetical protein
MAQPQRKPRVAPTSVWQEWTKKRAQQAPSLERIHEISRKVKINVTQLILEERRGE